MKIRELVKITENNESICDYFVSKGLIPEIKICYKCKKQMKLYKNRFLFYHKSKNCEHSIKALKTNFFGKKLTKISEKLICCFMILNKISQTNISKLIDLSRATINKWSDKVLRLVLENADECYEKIGGEGVIVEIDETKLGKRKYHKGHKVEGAWVIGGIERTKEKKCFFVHVDDRSAKTIGELINKYVLTGSIIYSDCWRGYKKPCLDLGFKHYTVNHTKYFKDPITSVHTNTIEGMNNSLKTEIPARNRNNKSIKKNIVFYMWRRKNKKNLWDSFLGLIK